jgi:hypothetical protein
MRAQIKHLLEVVGVSDAQMRSIAKESFVRATNLPEDARRKFVQAVEAWSGPMAQVPIADLHMHFAASVPYEYLIRVFKEITVPAKETGKAQRFVALPEMKSFDFNAGGAVVRAVDPWKNLSEFSQATYKHLFGVLLSEGISALADQITAIAQSCLSSGVPVMTMQIGPPQGYSPHWTKYFVDQMIIAQMRAKMMGAYLDYSAAYIRNAPIGATKPVRSLVDVATERAPRSRTWLLDVIANVETA